MKALRTLLIATLIFSFSLTSLKAQAVDIFDGTPYASMSDDAKTWAAERIATLDEVVSLTNDQLNTVKDITGRFAMRLDFLLQKEMDEEYLAKNKAVLFEPRMEQYKQVLTPEQVVLLTTNWAALEVDNEQ